MAFTTRGTVADCLHLISGSSAGRGYGGLRRVYCAVLARRNVILEAGGDHGNLSIVLHFFVLHGAKDNVGIFMRGRLNNGGSLIHLRQLE